MMTLTAVSALEKVYLTGEVPALETPLTLFEGDRVRFQVNLFSNENYCDAAIRMRAGMLSKGATMRRVGLVPAVLDAQPEHDDYYVIREDHLYPDVLENFDPAHIHGHYNTNQTFFITLFDNEKVTPGIHKVFVDLYNNGTKVATVRVTVNKLAARLPEQKLILTTWMHYDSFINQHHVKLFTADFYKLFASYLAAAREGGQNMLLVPLFTPAFDTQIGGERLTAQLLDIREPEDGKFVFDFTAVNKFVAFARAHGIEYLEMPPLFTQWGAKNAPKILVRDKTGRLKKRFGWQTDALSEEYRSFLRQLLTALHEDLVSIGMEEKTFFHVSDEPSLEQYDQYIACKNFMFPLIGKSRTVDACSHLEFAGKTDREYSVCSIATLDNYIKANVKPLCTYYCCGPTNNHFTNRFFSMPLARTAVLGLQLYRYDIALFLQWGFNFYNSYLSRRPISPYGNADADAVFTAGDAFLVYPDYPGFGANPSLRLYAMGEGIRISRMLYLLESLAGRDEALAFLDTEGVTGLNVYPMDRGWLDRLCARLAEKIASYIK